MLLASALLVNPLPAVIQTETDTASTEAVIELIEGVLEPKQDKIEQYTAPLVKAAEKRREARKKAERAAEQARLAALYVPPPPPPVYTPPAAPTPGSLIAGTYGYAIPYGNCINEPGINNPGWGNPISWPVTSFEPFIGATALWHYNHAGIVVGLWSNGDVEVRHQNYQSNQTRFPRSAFRGYR